MVTFRNNNGRRNTFRRNERNFKSNVERNKFNNNFSNSENFQRKAPSRNNHNASKLIDKYNDLAREASSNGDRILSENYLQHADHFTRIVSEQENFRKQKISENHIIETEIDTKNTTETKELTEKKEKKVIDEIKTEVKEEAEVN